MSKNSQLMTNHNESIPDEASENTDSYQAVKLNAMTHGILSRHTVLPHEDRNEYDTLLSLLIQEHQPQGMTEAHLVEELAGIMWRKQRVLLAEGAKINDGLASSSKSRSVFSGALPFHSGMSREGIEPNDLLRMTVDEITEYQKTSTTELQDILNAEKILEGNTKKAYQQALDLLCSEDRGWWDDSVEDEEYEASSEDLLAFILKNLKPWYEHQMTVATHHAEIKAQAFGEGVQPHRLVTLNRYETHLDRKFQRTLAMLIKLKEMRNANDS